MFDDSVKNDGSGAFQGNSKVLYKIQVGLFQYLDIWQNSECDCNMEGKMN